ncbi:MAG: hypothetical protein AB7S38_15935 [Vulcanimicrobiota bacterium]
MRRLLPLILGFLVLGCLPGCDDSQLPDQTTGSQGDANLMAPPALGRIIINFNLLNRGIPAEVASFSFTGSERISTPTGQVSNILFSQNDVPKQSQVILDNVSRRVQVLTIELFDGSGFLVGRAIIDLDFENLTVVIDDPDFEDVVRDLLDQLEVASFEGDDFGSVTLNVKFKSSSSLSGQVGGFKLKQSDNPNFPLGSIIRDFSNSLIDVNNPTAPPMHFTTNEREADGSIVWQNDTPLTSNQSIFLDLLITGGLQPGDIFTFAVLDLSGQEIGTFQSPFAVFVNGRTR